MPASGLANFVQGYTQAQELQNEKARTLATKAAQDFEQQYKLDQAKQEALNASNLNAHYKAQEAISARAQDRLQQTEDRKKEFEKANLDLKHLTLQTKIQMQDSRLDNRQKLEILKGYFKQFDSSLKLGWGDEEAKQLATEAMSIAPELFQHKPQDAPLADKDGKPYPYVSPPLDYQTLINLNGTTGPSQPPDSLPQGSLTPDVGIPGVAAPQAMGSDAPPATAASQPVTPMPQGVQYPQQTQAQVAPGPKAPLGIAPLIQQRMDLMKSTQRLRDAKARTEEAAAAAADEYNQLKNMLIKRRGAKIVQDMENAAKMQPLQAAKIAADTTHTQADTLRVQTQADLNRANTTRVNLKNIADKAKNIGDLDPKDIARFRDQNRKDAVDLRSVSDRMDKTFTRMAALNAAIHKPETNPNDSAVYKAEWTGLGVKLSKDRQDFAEAQARLAASNSWMQKFGLTQVTGPDGRPLPNQPAPGRNPAPTTGRVPPMTLNAQGQLVPAPTRQSAPQRQAPRTQQRSASNSNAGLSDDELRRRLIRKLIQGSGGR